MAASLDLLQRQLDELEALEGVYQHHLVLSHIEQEAREAARTVAAVSSPDHCASFPGSLSGTLTLPGVALLGASVGLRFVLPSTYPELEPASLAVECSAPRDVHERLEAVARSCAADAAGCECLLVAADALQEHLRALLEEQPHLAAPPGRHAAGAAGPSSSSAATAAGSPQQLARAVVWFHHIKSLAKRKAILQWARELGVSGYSKPGFPGVVICEGWREDVGAFIANIRSLTWQAMQVRAEETVELPATPEGAAADGSSDAGPGGRRAFAAAAFEELPETGLSELGAACRLGGVEHLFHAALKLDR